MYSYSFDLKSGGIVLNSSPTIFSKEPRPVWADELDLLGFDRYWNYEKQNDVPFMWAESNVYWYRGIQIAKTKGGDLYNAPELLPVRSEDGSIPFSKIDGYTLQPIDMEAMCRQNEELMTIVEDTTVKKIIKEYEKFKNRLDIFHVAFSGGKDSAVLLRDAGLIEKEKCTSFCNLICKIGWENDFALGLMLTNLAYDNAQFEWYIQNMDIGIYYDTNEIKEHLLAAEMKERAAKSIVKSFSRIVGTPFGTALNFGFVDGNDMVRTKCHMSDKRVFLYALYRFVERCNLNCEFNVSYLLDESVERDGVSPVRLFGIYEEEELRTILLGLSARYPEFINATFTNDLQSISLRDKTAADVLGLIEEDF